MRVLFANDGAFLLEAGDRFRTGSIEWFAFALDRCLNMHHGTDDLYSSDTMESNPLVTAIQSDEVTNIKTQLGGININAGIWSQNCEWNYLHVAAMTASAEIVRCLLEAGANVNCLGGPERKTPLHYAAERGDAAVARVLLQHGASVEVNSASC